MTKECAEIFIDYGGDLLLPEYSGKGMFGKTTCAVQFKDEQTFLSVLAEIMQSSDKNERAIVAIFLRTAQTDSLGKQILYY